MRPADRRAYFRLLEELSYEDRPQEFWVLYAEYLDQENVISPIRQAVHRMARRMADPNLVLVPRRLTAENGAKAELSGEFEEPIPNPWQCGCGECQLCKDYPDLAQEETIEHVVSWTVIKAIYHRAIDFFTRSTDDRVPAKDRNRTKTGSTGQD